MITTAQHEAATNFQKPIEFRSAPDHAPRSPSRSQVVPVSVQEPPRGRTWKSRALLAVAVLATVAVVVMSQPWKRFSAAAEAQPRATARTVKVDHPARVTTASVVLPATIRPWQTATLHARVSGYLTAWHRDLGARVKAGELLAEIETPELDQELAEVEALAAEAMAAAVQARTEQQEAEADLKVTEAQLLRVRAEAELAKSQHVRRTRLLVNRTITQEEFDIYQKELDARGADVAAAEADVVRRRTNLQTRAAVINAREATAKSRHSNVSRLQELVAFKRIVAPFDGVVTRRRAEVGMLVTTGKESLFVVEDMSRVRVQANVPQAYSSQTRRGVSTTVSVPESAVPAVAGTVTRIADSVDSASRTMLAEVELDNASGRFQPGSYAQLALNLPQSDTSWTIPTNTVQMRVEGPHVALVDDRGQVEVRRVTLGRDLGSRVVVVGIRGDERLIVNPADDLVSGAQVEYSDPELAPRIAQR